MSKRKQHAPEFGVNHDRLLLTVLGGQAGLDLREDALVAPPLPTVVKRLVRAVLNRRVTPTQPIAVDEDNPAQHTPIIDARLAVGLRKMGLKTRHLRICQPEEIRLCTARFSNRESRPYAGLNGS